MDAIILYTFSFSCCLQYFPASGSFPVSRLFPSGGQSTGASASATVLLMNIQGWFPLGWLYSIGLFTTRHIHSWVSFLLWLSHFVLTGAVSPLFSSSMLDIFWGGGAHLLGLCLFAFSYCPWGSSGKNTGVSHHSLLQWTVFCQNSLQWPAFLGWPHITWLIVSLSYASLFVLRLWSTQGALNITYRPRTGEGAGTRPPWNYCVHIVVTWEL